MGWLVSIAAILIYCWNIKWLVASKALEPSSLTQLICLLWFVLCGIGFSDAGSNTLLLVLCFYIAFAWGLSWLIRLMLVLRKKRDSSILKRTWRYWLIIPATLFLPMLLSQLGIFALLRFKLSEPALVEYVEQVRTGKVNIAFEFEYPPRQIGLYTLTVTNLLPDRTVRFITSSHFILDKAGFAHAPNNPPKPQGEASYQQINQQWWYYYQSW